ncbi:glycoside hydrolase family 9 protein [Amycolatopsis australiensis]|uniref:Endoglucanase n=1 Tax=Amycolatopsis australiensis TaxID=546364 RepID=A0A1K1S4F6_9PSEU|nr:glycoside hydrolase family 9 protein [Amycolatopsis australiensis]SFW78901.1 Fibronectin type III domain-containing protein [Amycolatopsis australiensis]
MRARKSRAGLALLTAVALGLVTGTVPASAAEYERLINGTFSSGTLDPWWAGAGTTGHVTDGEFCTDVPGGTANGYDALAGQNGVPFEAGQQYTLTFDAHATTTQQISAVAGEAVSPYRQISRTDLTVTPSTQHFTVTFTSTLDFPAAGNGQLAFWFGGQAAANTVCLDNISLVGGVLPPGGQQPLSGIQVDQDGYVPGLPERATLVSDSTTPVPWTLKNSAGVAVASGQTTARGADAASGAKVHEIDFSAYTTVGTGYTLSAGGQTSFPFDISPDVRQKLRYDSLAFFYHQRSGIAIDAAYVGAAYARPAGHVNVAPNQGDNNVPCRSDLNCGYTLDVRGGWYDAGDHGKYVVNGGIAAWELLDEYERAVRLGDASALGDGKLAIPERANGVPDILDEARWEVDFLLSMQVPDGKPNAGMVHHKIHDAQWTSLPTRPDQDSQPRRLSAPSTAATLNMAAVAAQASRLWRTIDPAYSAKLLAAAEKAYAAAKANPNVLADPNDGTGGGTYSDSNVTDEFYWAAAELFATTGKSTYRGDVTGSSLYRGVSFNTHGFDWGSTGALGDITLALVPTDLPAADVAAIKSAITTTADSHLTQMSSMGYPAPYRTADGTYEWGSNGLVANNGVVLALAYDFTKQDKYRDGAFAAMDYLLGRNPANYSYVSGHGDRPVQNVHHRFWAHELDPSLPIAPPGALSGGPNSGLQDPTAARLLAGCAPQRCFVDDIQAYSVNEVAINWNSALAWLSGWVAEKSPSGVDTTPPAAPGTPAVSAVSSSGATLTWAAAADPESGVKSYDVVRVNGSARTVLATVTGTTATLTGLSASTAYTVVVVARNGVGLTSQDSPSAQFTTKPATPAGGCAVTYTTNTWTGGFTAAVTVKNTGTTAWSGWKLAFTFPGSQKVTQGWSATWAQSGADVTATAMPWNGSVAPGQSVSIGFNGSYTGTNTNPAAFTVDGRACG